MRYLQGDPWDAEDRKARRDAGRPCLNQDELNQYVNQAVNNVRQNKREMKVAPDGNGATNRTANLQEDLVRTIQKNSRAANVYCKSFQDMLEGSYGFYRIGRKRKKGSRNQYITISSIANPDSVLFDPRCKQPDWSDGKGVYVLDPIRRDEFTRRWPKAQKVDFNSDEARGATEWVKDNEILVCEHWYLEPGKKTYSDDEGEWDEDEYTLYQCFTNGIELLQEPIKQPGEILPIIPMFGLERWLNKEGSSKREINSAVRLARDPQMGLAYAVSAEAEDFGMTPKTPYEGFVGQFETDADTLKTVTKVPHAFVQFDIVYDSGGQVLPRPTRTQYVPNSQAFEVAIDSRRRAVQAAMGVTPLPTAAQRDSQKSGVALERVSEQMSVGLYHFVDKYEMALELGCRCILGWIPPTYDTEREEALHKKDGSRRVVTLNSENPPINEKTQQAEAVDVSEGDHQPDIMTAPNQQSEREAVSDFSSQIIQNLAKMEFLAPQQKQKLLSMNIKLHPELGVLGEEMAEIISPPDADTQQALAQMQQQGALMQKQMADLAGEVQKLKLEKAGKMLDNQGKKDIEKMKIDADIAKSEISTKAQKDSERTQFVQEVWTELHGAAHDLALQKDSQDHEQGMAAMQGAQADNAQASDQGFQAQQAENQPEPAS